ncbi:MAG: NifU family protein [Patescibacteria group bacterium]
MQDKIKKALAKIRPNLKAHGGNVRLIKIEPKKGLVYVRLQGACAGCPMAEITLQQGIEKFLKAQIKGVKKVISV